MLDAIRRDPVIPAIHDQTRSVPAQEFVFSGVSSRATVRRDGLLRETQFETRSRLTLGNDYNRRTATIYTTWKTPRTYPKDNT
jgi:hypothetical protein